MKLQVLQDEYVTTPLTLKVAKSKQLYRQTCTRLSGKDTDCVISTPLKQRKYSEFQDSIYVVTV